MTIFFINFFFGNDSLILKGIYDITIILQKIIIIINSKFKITAQHGLHIFRDLVITYKFSSFMYSFPSLLTGSQSVSQSVTTFIIDVEFRSVLIIILFCLWRKFVIFSHGISYHPLLSSTQVPTTTQFYFLFF